MAKSLGVARRPSSGWVSAARRTPHHAVGSIPARADTIDSVRRRGQFVPWMTAGRVTELQASADEVVQETGWVFNNETGAGLSLEQFVLTGDQEVPAYLTVFGLRRSVERRQDPRRDRLWNRSDDVCVHPGVRNRDRLRSRCGLPRALHRDGRPVRKARPARRPSTSPTDTRWISNRTRPIWRSATSRSSTATPTMRSTSPPRRSGS